MRLMKAARGLIATVVTGGVAIGLCLAAIIPGAGVITSAYDAPVNVDARLRNLLQRSTIYASDGTTVIGVLGTENREDVSLDEVPEVIQDAVVAVEDQTFWENSGVDLNAMIRALLTNLTSGEIEQGGSTITQQLVKNRVLSDKRDVRRKFRELILARQLNGQYSKREILEQYLNTVYFGQGSYGIKSAVERFFDKPLSEVTAAEAALLAGVIANPEGDNPFTNPQRAQERRSDALNRMVDQHYITQAEANAAEDEPLPTVLPPAELRPTNAWVEEIQDRIVADPGDVFGVLGDTPAEREERLLTGGLKIYSGLDFKIQAAADAAASSGVPASMRNRGFTMSILAMDPRTGVVKAMVPGTDFATSQYNIATSYPGRQGGSSWKALTLTAAIDAGFSPNDLVNGTTPCDFGTRYGRTINYESSPAGVLTLRAATAASVNCAFARIELATGFEKVIDTAHKLGITQDLLPVLTLTLGVIEGTALEMANVAATLANDGMHRTPLFVSRIENADGDVVFAAEDVEGERAVSAETAACTTNLLQGVVNGGTGGRARLSGRQVAGKTGTSDQNADANFMGYTPQLAAHIWYGNIAGRVPGAGAGGGIPAATFKRFFDAALAGEPALPFPPPGPACGRPGAFITEFGRSATPGVGFPTTTLPGPPPTVIINTTTTTTTTTTLPVPP